ncbi:hypothetical protein AAFF_G00189870 [Aldrovandia affinis]|uniref:Uncharacterized protein n=1 Tax=Aldrovandia affinis TaxID=143900 RepID=A0AAD7R0Q4_9TELE|nr:hypothetical protein AAFF_G00136240 [Aldrovandia affinis]KAJ8367377.1 hypothetical protein AAFF_G00320460 [Aldrovandia affinis]KAJ8385366.1 hypothetical protein AAFF_G00189870 [Aldrovandia affinis]
MQDNRDDRGQSRMRTQQYRDRRGNPVNARGDPLNCPFGNRLCEYGVRGGAGRECWNYHPLASKLGEDPRFRAGYVGDSPDGGDGANGTRGSDPIRCTSCGLRRPLLRNDPLRCAEHLGR